LTSEVLLPRSWRFAKERSLQIEAMDNPDLDPALREQALEGLGRLRRIFLRPGPLLRAIVRILPPPSNRTLRLVELGAGSRELSAWLTRALERTGRRVEMVPTDRIAAPGVRAFDCTAASGWLDADMFFSNLLLHHLSVDEIRRSLRMQAQHARYGSVHLDLVRTGLSYYLSRLFLPLLRYPRIIQSDGLLSIQAAFTAMEMRGLAEGICRSFEVHEALPFRQTLTCSPEASPFPRL
jgi:hypothetical protein